MMKSVISYSSKLSNNKAQKTINKAAFNTAYELNNLTNQSNNVFSEIINSSELDKTEKRYFKTLSKQKNWITCFQIQISTPK